MAGRLRRFLCTVPKGGVDLSEVAALAARSRPSNDGGLSPSAALARELLAKALAGTDPHRCRVLGPGRLVGAATLPFDCPMTALADSDGAAAAGIDWLVVGDALAAADDPPAELARLAHRLQGGPALRLLAVLPGTALMPDDDPPCPRGWLFSRVSGEAMARAAFAGRDSTVRTLGNVLAASADLLGLGADQLWPEELLANDPEYPMVVTIAATL